MHLGRLAPGDEVIVPANTYIATVLAVTDCGLVPVMVEPDVLTMNIDTSAYRGLSDAKDASCHACRAYMDG